MRRMKPHQALPVLLALAGPASAAPTPVVIPAPASCGAPSAVTCHDAAWVKYCSQGAPTYVKSDGTTVSGCWPYLQAEVAAYRDSLGPPTEKYFRSADSELATSATPDTFVAATPPRPAGGMKRDARSALLSSWSGQTEAARIVAQQSPVSADPSLGAAQYQRYFDTQPAFAMNSCENYVYRRFYDVERWIDALNACDALALTQPAGAAEKCKVAITLNGLGPHPEDTAAVPGIARAAMHDSEGSLISKRLERMAEQGLIQSSEAEPFDVKFELNDLEPKNGFYAGTEHFFVPELVASFPPDEQAWVEALRNELHRGATLYDLTGDRTEYDGTPYQDETGVHRGFTDEWDFHRWMFQKWGNTTDGEAREYRRRVDGLFAELDLAAHAFRCTTIASQMIGGECGPGMPSAIGKVGPGDTQMWEDDMFRSAEIYSAILPAQLVATPAAFGLVGFGADLQPAAFTGAQFNAGAIATGSQAYPMSAHHPLSSSRLRSNPDRVAFMRSREAQPVLRRVTWPGLARPDLSLNVDGVAPPAPALDVNIVNQTAGVMNTMWATHRPRIETTRGYPRLDCSAPLPAGTPPPTRGGLALIDEVPVTEGPWAGMSPDWQQRWKTACAASNVIIDEWGRKRLGRPSCLDPKSTRCDWSPRAFVDHFVSQYVGYGSTAKEAEYRYCRRWTGGGNITAIPANERKNFGALVENVIHTPGVLENKRLAFEKIFKKLPIKAPEDFGLNRYEKNGVGNDMFGGKYDYSLGWHGKVYARTPDNDNLICRMGGNAMASFNATATLFGNDFSIVKMNVNASANEGDSGRSRAKAFVEIVGFDVLDTGGWVNFNGQSGNYSPDPELKGDRVPLFSVPFQVGWVTVTVSGGVNYFYGASTDFKMKAPAPGSCPKGTSAGELFGVDALLSPQAGLGAWVDADVSLLGIIGVGIEVELTLLKLSLPLHVATKFLQDGQTHKLALTFDADLKLRLETLSGSLSAYLELFWTHVFSITLVDWDGFSYSIPIFSTPKTALDVWDMGGATIAPVAGYEPN